MSKTIISTPRAPAAQEAFAQGIRVAEARGDKQAAKEMSVFRKRLLRP